MTIPAVLVLADGTIFEGVSIGYEGQTVGEVVYNTDAFGYQETLTDPMSMGRIIAFTYPHIGNSGVNEDDAASARIQAAGLVIRDLPLLASNFRSEESLSDYLRRHQIVAIAEIDTRRLTRHLRETGAQAGCIVTGNHPDILEMQGMAQHFSMPLSQDLISMITTPETYEWHEGQWQLDGERSQRSENPLHIVVYDFGVTRDQLRLLFERGCKVTIVPAHMRAQDVLALEPNGIFLSTGPSDPRCHMEIVSEIKAFVDAKIPLFAVGLGHQLLALTVGAKCEKRLDAHYGANYPVQNCVTQQVFISRQTSGFQVTKSTLPSEITITYCDLTTGEVQGLQLPNQDTYSFQGSPEGDMQFLFDQLIDAMWAH